jgi:hypothetical protein
MMPGSNNFLQFDSNLNNAYSDANYAELSQITDGIQIGIADPMMHNKLFYQLSTFVAAMAQVFANLGYVVNDSSISALTTVLSNTLTTNSLWQSFTGDFHAQTTNGFYVTTAAGQTDAPTSGDKYYLIVATTGTLVYHLAIDAATGFFYFEIYNTTWSTWTEMPTGASGSVTATMLATGAAVSNIGYTPANKAGDTFTGAINECAVTMPSAATMAIGAAAGNFILVTGTTTITSFDTVQAGTKRTLRFGSALTVTYNATSMILSSGANITVTTGDTIEFISLGSGNWFGFYQPKAGYAMPGANSNITSLAGLTTPLSIAQGGTGANTAILAKLALGIPIVATEFKNFVQTVTSNTAATIAADYCPYTGATISLTLSTSTTGANALDTGTIAASTWYYTYVIYGTAGGACLMSLSSSAPTLPTGYTYYCRVGVVRTNASNYLYRTIQYGRRTQYIMDGTILTGLPTMASGTAGSFSTPTWVAISTGSFVPPTAFVINLSVSSPGGNSVIVAPNSAYGGDGNSTNPPFADTHPNSNSQTITVSMILESINVYWAASGASCGLFCSGWEDNL